MRKCKSQRLRQAFNLKLLIFTDYKRTEKLESKI